MNKVLPSPFIERDEQLVLGIEPLDAQRRARIARRIDVALDGVPVRPGEVSWDDVFGMPDAIGLLPSIPRHDSCRHALVFTASQKKPLTVVTSRPARRMVLFTHALKSPVTIRLFDASRRFVPRRLQYPIPAKVDDLPPPARVRRPALYPGAAYDVSPNATGMRGRVTLKNSNDIPARWVRVLATINNKVVGVAHGDDRGEFLLMLQSQAGGPGELPVPIVADVTVFRPSAPPLFAANDPLSDLPIEQVVGEPDDISPGNLVPPGYVSTASSTRVVKFSLGTMLTNQPKFFFAA
jgi:hypothetical protein